MCFAWRLTSDCGGHAYLELFHNLVGDIFGSDQDGELLVGAGITQRVRKNQSTGEVCVIQEKLFERDMSAVAIFRGECLSLGCGRRTTGRYCHWTIQQFIELPSAASLMTQTMRGGGGKKRRMESQRGVDLH